METCVTEQKLFERIRGAQDFAYPTSGESENAKAWRPSALLLIAANQLLPKWP